MLRIDSNLIWIIVNLLIFYFLIRKFLFKPVLNIIEKRKQMVTEQFEKSRYGKCRGFRVENSV